MDQSSRAEWSSEPAWFAPYQLKLAARARELVEEGTSIESACRIIILEDQLEEAQRINEELRATEKHT